MAKQYSGFPFKIISPRARQEDSRYGCGTRENVAEEKGNTKEQDSRRHKLTIDVAVKPLNIIVDKKANSRKGFAQA